MSANHARSRPPCGPRIAIEVLDVEVLRDRAGRDEPFVVEQLEDFLCRGVSMQEVLAAADARDFDLLETLTHRLKGALVSLAATTAAAAAGEVELRAATLAISGDSPDARAIVALTGALLELDERFDEVSDAMRIVMDDATSVTCAVSAR
jgi:hypothetical protein